MAFVQNGRKFDYLDIVANICGSLLGLGSCAWYHLRMLERKRKAKGYTTVGEEDEGGLEDDIELGGGTGGHQESEVTTAGQHETTIDEDLDNWDENAADDWDEEVPHPNGETKDGLAIKRVD